MNPDFGVDLASCRKRPSLKHAAQRLGRHDRACVNQHQVYLILFDSGSNKLAYELGMMDLWGSKVASNLPNGYLPFDFLSIDLPWEELRKWSKLMFLMMQLGYIVRRFSMISAMHAMTGPKQPRAR
jgi:hypothetical protein